MPSEPKNWHLSMVCGNAGFSLPDPIFVFLPELYLRFVVMTSSILFYKRHMRASSPDFFVAPVFQTGFWDLRNGGDTTAENFQAGQVRMYGRGEKQLCDELEDFVEALMKDSQDAQRKVMTEINQA
jgi:hypothetical protein